MYSSDFFVLWFIVVAVVIILAAIFFRYVPVGLWINARASGAGVRIFSLVGMRFRRINPSKIVLPMIKATKAGLNVNMNELEAHLLAGGSVDRVSDIVDRCDITVLSGDDSLTLPMMSVGAKGIISVASNIIPGELSEMVELALAGDFIAARKIHAKYYRLFCNLFIESNPIPVKAAMEMMGMGKAEYRLPLCELAPKNEEILRDTLKGCGLI